MKKWNVLQRAGLILLSVMVLPSCALNAELASLPGTTLVLNTAITVDPHRATAYIQGGRITPPPQLDRYHPHCVIELRRVRDIPQRIEPDRFTVTKVRTDVYHAALGRHLAALSVTSDATPSYMMWTTELFLQSARQPDVMRLSCQHMEDLASQPRHVTLTEMRQTLGQVATLDTPR